MMAAPMDSGKWVFTKEQLQNTPSRRCNIDYDKEIFYRQQAATLIQEMGQRLQVTQLCINTAIVYVHRFYMFHSFNKFHRNPISSCALFLAAKVEEQPRKLEHVIRVAHMILYKDQRNLDINSEQYIEQAQELINNENILLQTLGFDVAIDHPHTQVLKCCQHLFRASSSKDMAQTSYFMATNSLHLTTMCLQYKPTVVACVCIHLVCKWFNFEIPQSAEGKDWFWYVDKTVTLEMLDELTVEFLAIFNKCPSRLRKRVMQQPGVNASAMTSSDKNAPGSSSKDASSSHPDAHKVRNESSGSSSGSAAPKPGERVPRPHDQRRDKTGTLVPPSSSTASVPAGHRPSSNSGHPPSHSNRPPESAGGGGGGAAAGGHHHHHHHQQQQQQQHQQQLQSGHSSSRPPHPHQRSSSGSIKDLKQPAGSSNSSSMTQSSTSQHHHHQQQQLQQQQQQRLQQQPVPQNTSSSQRKPVPPSSVSSNKVQQPSSGGSSSGSLFSPPRIDQQSERKPNDIGSSRNKPSTSAFGQDWPGNGNLGGMSSSAASSQQTQMNLSASLGFSLDLDICEDQDSTWDINYGLEPNSLLGSPNAAIESMLMNSTTGEGASTSGFQIKQQHQSLFSMLAPSPKLQQPIQQQHPTNPQLPSTPQPQITPQQVQQQQLQQPPQLVQQPSLRESLFDLGLDNEPFSSVVKTEDAMACIEIKSTPAAEVVVSAPVDEEVDPSSGKKKKKDKKKHKNKDKDREGKEKEKKHKHKHKEKDKEKVREKEKYKEAADGPRLKISGVSQSPVEDQATLVKPVIKIKIPKGRIEGDVATTPTNGSNDSQQPMPAASPIAPGGGLKIKISREMISSNNSKEKESSRKRASTTSSSSLNKTSLPSAKQPKMEAIPQHQPQQQQLHHPPPHHHQQQHQQHQFQSSSSTGRPHHERNGSSSNVAPEENRQRSHSTHRSSSTNINKVGHSSMQTFSAPSTASTSSSGPSSASAAAAAAAANAANAYNRAAGGFPSFAPTYPPPGSMPPMGHPPFYNPFPPAYAPYHMYPPYPQGPPMPPMMNNHIHAAPIPPSMATGVSAGMPPLPREPPPQVPPPPPPQPH